MHAFEFVCRYNIPVMEQNIRRKIAGATLNYECLSSLIRKLVSHCCALSPIKNKLKLKAQLNCTTNFALKSCNST